MTIEKRRHDGAYVISDIIKGHLVTKVYMGYSKREAAKLFRMESSMNKNPHFSLADEAAARELYLFLANDGDLYRQQGLPIIKNLIAKIDRGIYDRTKAIKLYGHYAESGAKKYAKEYGGTWYEMFNKATRELVAKNFVANFETECKLGNYNEFHAKKYQKTKGMLNNPIQRNVIFKAYIADKLAMIIHRYYNKRDEFSSSITGGGWKVHTLFAPGLGDRIRYMREQIVQRHPRSKWKIVHDETSRFLNK